MNRWWLITAIAGTVTLTVAATWNWLGETGKNLSLNLVAEIVGIVVTVLLIEWVIKRDDKQREDRIKLYVKLLKLLDDLIRSALPRELYQEQRAYFRGSIESYNLVQVPNGSLDSSSSEEAIRPTVREKNFNHILKEMREQLLAMLGIPGSLLEPRTVRDLIVLRREITNGIDATERDVRNLPSEDEDTKAIASCVVSICRSASQAKASIESVIVVFEERNENRVKQLIRTKFLTPVLAHSRFLLLAGITIGLLFTGFFLFPIDAGNKNLVQPVQQVNLRLERVLIVALIVLAVVGILVLYIRRWLLGNQPIFTVLSIERTLRFEDADGYRATLIDARTVRANYNGLTEFSFEGIMSDGSINDILIEDEPPSYVQNRGGVIQVIKRFPHPLGRSQQFNTKLSYELINAFTGSRESFIHSVGYENKKLRLYPRTAKLSKM